MTARLNISIKSLFRLAAGLMLLAVSGLAGDTAAPKPLSRAEATAIIANARKIVTPNGIERLETVRIGGIDQVGVDPGPRQTQPRAPVHPRWTGLRLDADELVVQP